MCALQVGTARAVSGEMTRGTLTLGYGFDAPIEAPVVIAAGRNPGPTLWVQALIHGTEVGGTIAIARFLKGLDLAALRGTIVGLPVVNPLAFRAWARNVPVDGFNQNRVFPGSPGGSFSEQAAHTLLGTAMATADAILDLHSGGDRSFVPHYALYWADGSAASNEAGRLARAAGTQDIWQTTDHWLTGAMFTLATQRGKPALIVECGGGAAVPEGDLAKLQASLTGVGQALGIVPGEAPRRPSYRVMGESDLLMSGRGGLFVAACKPGDVLQAGQEVGRVVDVLDNVQQVITAPYGPAYIASIRRTYHALNSGEQVAEIIHVVEGA